jgi:hypothetical protein
MPMQKKNREEVPVIDSPDNIISSLNKRVRELEEELNRLRVN